ncbi:hypothetical protein GPECTOR_13g622 [Gonium pectorale]|uniref:Uncharacterized protein n=1 Tax=Gonium pectorale TaxID=33097 RepID=A0A150GMY2_GONPE|nr:hypothetical protein GPECTOR_13g622 [Gonium pectorale]|eukprot:KXZ51135.1 hypothetical protein GPECTOR_13g622 [Gonium pectorale]
MRSASGAGDARRDAPSEGATGRDRTLPFPGQVAAPAPVTGRRGPPLTGEPMTHLPPPIRIATAAGSSGGSGGGNGGNGGDSTPTARQQTTPTAGAAASPTAGGMYGGLMSPRSPHLASPRHRFDLEAHMAAVEAALPMSPSRSTAAHAAVARAAAAGVVSSGGALGGLLAGMGGGAGDVMDEEGIEEILDDVISRGACT